MNRSDLSDTIVGLVPNVVIRQGLQSREFAILVTNARSIFVAKPSNLFMLDERSRGSAVNVLADGRLSAEVPVGRDDPDVMATDPRNFVIRHEWLERIRLRKETVRSRYELRFEYLLGSGKRKRVRARLVAPLVPGSGRLGPEKDRGLGYAKSVQALYMRAFPGSFSEELFDWEL